MGHYLFFFLQLDKSYNEPMSMTSRQTVTAIRSEQQQQHCYTVNANSGRAVAPPAAFNCLVRCGSGSEKQVH